MENRTVPPYYLTRLGQLQEDFHSEAAKFMHIMTNGGGLKNMHMEDTIRRLNVLYLQIAAHLDAARDINSQVTLDTGHRALAMARAMVSDEDKNEDGT
jgi:hypothetical protein